jgi:hypothetical protein
MDTIPLLTVTIGIIETALKSKIGSEMFSDFCHDVLAIRKKSWEVEVENVSKSELCNVILSLRRLFI